MKNNIAKTKSFDFAVGIVILCKKINHEKRNYEITSQLLRSGTAIGALINEAEYAESRKDFAHKLAIALKEANETKYWIDLLRATEIIDQKTHEEFSPKIRDLLRLLIAITKTLKLSNQKTRSN